MWVWVGFGGCGEGTGCHLLECVGEASDIGFGIGCGLGRNMGCIDGRRHIYIYISNTHSRYIYGGSDGHGGPEPKKPKHRD